MKLYATVTSERATKGQGGNKKIVSSFTVERMGENIEVVRVQMLYDKEQGYIVVVQFPHHQSTETRLEMNEYSNLYSISESVRDDQKGKRQTGEICNFNACKNKAVYYGVCDKHRAVEQ